MLSPGQFIAQWHPWKRLFTRAVLTEVWAGAFVRPSCVPHKDWGQTLIYNMAPNSAPRLLKPPAQSHRGTFSFSDSSLSLTHSRTVTEVKTAPAKGSEHVLAPETLSASQSHRQDTCTPRWDTKLVRIWTSLPHTSLYPSLALPDYMLWLTAKLSYNRESMWDYEGATGGHVMIILTRWLTIHWLVRFDFAHNSWAERSHPL